MLRQLALAAIVAAVTSLVTLQLAAPGAGPATAGAELDGLATALVGHPALQSAFASVQLKTTAKPEIEAWLAGVGADGLPRPGPGDDIKSLAPADKSVCFLTDIEIQHVSDASDQLACRVAIDEFTGYWEVHAIQGEGTDASVRCNAMCLTW